MTAPNIALRAARTAMRMSQDDFAQAIRAAGDKAGRPNDASKRLVQRWESGTIATPRPVYARALEMVTGLPIELLGFPAGVDAIVVDDGRGGHDLEVRAPSVSGPGGEVRHGTYSGVWLSRYEYFSSGRGSAFTGLHYVVLLQHGDRLTVRSLPGSADSTMTMDLSVEDSIITGSWVEQTVPQSYYRGARYHGAIQLVSEPTRRRMAGKWLGFGREMEVNTGPWTLSLEDTSTSKTTLAKYDRPPEA